MRTPLNYSTPKSFKLSPISSPRMNSDSILTPITTSNNNSNSIDNYSSSNLNETPNLNNNNNSNNNINNNNNSINTVLFEQGKFGSMKKRSSLSVK